MKTTARVRRVGIYVRISDDREGGGLGTKRQREDCEQEIDKLGWKFVDLYKDDDTTAADRRKKRRECLRMLEDVESAHIDAIVTGHPDRLYRQPAELEDLIIIVEDHKTEIATVKAGDLDLSTPTGRLVARMLGAIAKYEVNTSRSASSARSRSWWPPGRSTTPATGPSVMTSTSTVRARAERSPTRPSTSGRRSGSSAGRTGPWRARSCTAWSWTPSTTA
ncbi:recombinase family protein [Streptomyces sp. S1A1-7]|uniref:recombinase family protein n=1 Tax=Streptomyces sp. S1A1-7 TaxID=2594459 RepID=UPI0013DE7DDF|nr:recombinase family protein [Streptomyces sp. S1A1-7]